MQHDASRAECVHERAAIDRLIAQQAALINARYGTTDAQNPVLVLAVMTGALVYAGQLLPQLTFPLTLDYVHASRYDGARAGGALHWLAKSRQRIAGRRVLVLDDILDEGITLAAIVDWLKAEGAAEVAIAVLTQKQKATAQPCSSDFPVLMLPDRYVYGFGLDADDLWRNADGIFVTPDA